MRAPTLLFRSTRPLFASGDEVLSAADARVFAELLLPDYRIVEVPEVDHFGIVLGSAPGTIAAMRAFLELPSSVSR